MSEYKLKTPKQAGAAVDAYRKVEDTVAGVYKKIEDSVVGSYKAIEKKFVDTFLEKAEGDGQSRGASPSAENSTVCKQLNKI